MEQKSNAFLNLLSPTLTLEHHFGDNNIKDLTFGKALNVFYQLSMLTSSANCSKIKCISTEQHFLKHYFIQMFQESALSYLGCSPGLWSLLYLPTCLLTVSKHKCMSVGHIPPQFKLLSTLSPSLTEHLIFSTKLQES